LTGTRERGKEPRRSEKKLTEPKREQVRKSSFFKFDFKFDFYLIQKTTLNDLINSELNSLESPVI